MKKLFLLTLFFWGLNNLLSQTCESCEVKLPNLINSTSTPFEFSSIAEWKTKNGLKVLLVPTLRNGNIIYAIDSTDIANSIYINNKNRAIVNVNQFQL